MSRWIKLLVYARHGIGKTTLAGSAADVPEMTDVLFIDAERGDMSLEDNPRIKNIQGISHVNATSHMQVARIQEFLKAHCVQRDNPTPENIDKMRKNEAWLRGIDPKDIPEPKKFKTAVVDSLTEVDTYCMYGLMGVNQDQIITGKAEEIAVAQWGEFRKNNMMMQMLIRAFRDLPMHVIFTCQQVYNQDEMKRFHYGPALTGQLARQAQGMVDIVGSLRAAEAPDETGKQPRRLYVQPMDRYDAKNRRASYKEAFFDDPTMGSIMRAVGLLTT